MHRTSLRSRLAMRAQIALAVSALGCDGVVEAPTAGSSPSTAVDAAVPRDPLTPVVTPMNDGGQRPGRRADAGESTSPGSDGAGAASADGVPLFVAVGDEGRTLVSCDDGASWVADKSNGDARCGDCDHSTGVPTGLAFADGRFFSSRGWGVDGALAYSDDGEAWTKVPFEGRWNGLAAGKGLLYVQGSQYTTNSSKVSTNGGESFEDRATPTHGGQVRGDVYLLDGKLWMINDEGDVRARTSTDQGRTWKNVTIDGECMLRTQPHQGGLAYDGKSVLIFINSLTGAVCRSTDHGGTFRASAQLGAGTTTPILWVGDQFWVYTRNRLRRSRDGITWTDTATSAQSLKPIARSDDGTWVASNDGAYQEQQMLRSRDGITWEVLPAERFKQGHRIRRIVFGKGTKPRACE